MFGRLGLICCCIALGWAGTIYAARNYIDIVGSSTLYPFSTVVAERFGRSTPYRVPMVRPTGTGSGFNDFCQGLGDQTVDINNASRRIKESERELCRENGVTDIFELPVGFDGIVLATSTASPDISLTLAQLYLALAYTVPANGQLVDNPYQRWSEIDASLPDTNIEVLGPPPTSGTRDAFVELAMQAGCESFAEIRELKSMHDDVCHHMREDGHFIEAGENDNFILQKLNKNPLVMGIFGFSFLQQNRDLVKPVKINQVAPSLASITDGHYPLTRPLYMYVKTLHLHVVPGLADFLAEYTSAKAWGENGYLTYKGLIPLEPSKRRELVTSLQAIQVNAYRSAP